MQEKLICEWIAADAMRMHALRIARDLGLPDWCIAAGFVRNLVWDKLHGFDTPTPLADIDLVYYDPSDASRERDRAIERRLAAVDAALPWSMHNQARMHERNGDAPYRSTVHAMSYWVELETAVGVRLHANDELDIVSAFGLDSLMLKKITPNRKRYKPSEFSDRVAKKNWLWKWPDLRIEA